jgi:hypothetical protein
LVKRCAREAGEKVEEQPHAKATADGGGRTAEKPRNNPMHPAGRLPYTAMEILRNDPMQSRFVQAEVSGRIEE